MKNTTKIIIPTKELAVIQIEGVTMMLSNELRSIRRTETEHLES